VNKDLADVLGNFVSRVTKFCAAKFGTEVPGAGEYGPAEHALIADLQTRLEAYQRHMDAIDIRKSTAELRGIWAAGNEYLQAAAPWTVFKTDPDRAAAIIRLALYLIPVYGVLSAPFIPDAAKTIAKAMDCTAEWPSNMQIALAGLAPGHAFTVPEVMFAKISDEAREELENRFAGR